MGHRLSKIVTRTGDTGTTGLSDGSRIAKDAPRIEAIGTVDELSSCIGFAHSLLPEKHELREALSYVQHDLFDLGGALSHPDAALLTPAHVARLDTLATSLNEGLPPLKEFILPGGAPAISALHMARTMARRAERRVISLLEVEPQDGAQGMAYLNRLSDVLFIAARRVAQDNVQAEHLWQQGKSLS